MKHLCFLSLVNCGDEVEGRWCLHSSEMKGSNNLSQHQIKGYISSLESKEVIFSGEDNSWYTDASIDELDDLNIN
jgi:hypothetical protein